MKEILVLLAVCSTHASGQNIKSTTSKVVNVEIGHRYYWPKRLFVRIVSASTQTQDEYDTTSRDQRDVKAPLVEKRTETIVGLSPRHFWRRGSRSYYSLVFNR